MQRQKDSVNLMTFIKPHQSGFLLSIILAVISVTSGIVPYFAVARIVNLLIGGETNFSAYLTWGIVALIAYLMKSVFHGFSTRCSHSAVFPSTVFLCIWISSSFCLSDEAASAFIRLSFMWSP